MSRCIYRILLWLLPPSRRQRFGEDMAGVFDDLRTEERRHRGAAGVVWLWLVEAIGMARFVAHEWLRVVGVGHGPGAVTELRWALRGVVARRGSAVFIVLFLGVTLGLSTATFAVLDSFVFHRSPFPEPQRIVRIAQTVDRERTPDRLESAALHDAWRSHRDLFQAVGGFLSKSGVFLIGDEKSERVPTADVTLELFDVLGIKPRWGRRFQSGDLRDTSVLAAMLSEDLARRYFGTPANALGRRLNASGTPLVVVGVMDRAVAFPSPATRMWRLLDVGGPLAENFGGISLIARVSTGVPMSDISGRVAERTPAVGASAGVSGLQASAAPYFVDSWPSAVLERRARLLLVFGASIALLLIACANAVSVELAHAIRRRHAYAVQVTLGASRASIARVLALEEGLLVFGALMVALFCGSSLVDSAVAYLPEAIQFASQNPIDSDRRAVVFLLLACAVVWILLWASAVLFAWRRLAGALLSRSTPEGAARFRQILTTGEVGLAVALVVVGLLYTRSYLALSHVEKGIDTAGLAVVSAETPADYFDRVGGRDAFLDRLLEEVRRIPGVSGATSSEAPPAIGDSPQTTPIEIDRRIVAEGVRLGRLWIDDAYLSVTGLPLVEGRPLRKGDSLDRVVVSESFARRFWPGASAVGRTFRGGQRTSFENAMTVVGVVGDFRFEATRMPSVNDSRFYLYTMRTAMRQPNLPQSIAASWVISGGSYGGVSLTVRTATPAAVAAVASAVQRLDPRLSVSVKLVDEMYAAQHAETLLAARVMATFGGAAFLLAVTGLYGVIVFLVAGRTREIGIRMALGAARRDIHRMILASSARMVLVGSVVGVVAAFVLARWIESQLFGVSSGDATIYAGVVGVVAATAVAAAWMPARRATSIDPAITLRSE
jgi:predicted permease